MDSRNRPATGVGDQPPLAGDSFPSPPLGGTMDAPPMPVADRFTEEIAVGTSADRLTDGGALPQHSFGLPDTSAAGPDSGSGGSSGTAAAAADKAKDVARTVSDKAQEASGAVADKAQDAAGAVADQAKAAPGQLKSWIQAHPMVAVGAGLVGGMILGGSGGGEHHHHYHGDGSEGQHQSSGKSGQSGAGRGSSGSGKPGGLVGMIEQTGLLDTITESAERAMKMANGHVAELLRQRIPGFDDQLRQAAGPTASVPATTVPPTPTRTVTTLPPAR